MIPVYFNPDNEYNGQYLHVSEQCACTMPYRLHSRREIVTDFYSSTLAISRQRLGNFANIHGAIRLVSLQLSQNIIANWTSVFGLDCAVKAILKYKSGRYTAKRI